MKIKISYKNTTRTFFTRKNWKNGKKLYLYYYRQPRLTGNWYTDPNYQTWSWQDYEREYERQCRGENTEILSDTVIKMKELVSKHNDEILKMMEKGITYLKLEDIVGDTK